MAMHKTWMVAFAGLALTGASQSDPLQQAISGLGQGYLPAAALLDAGQILPPSPVRGSATEKRDKEAQKEALKHYGDARWQLAELDADVFTPAATGAFSCAAGFDISPKSTPVLDALMRKSMVTMGYSVAKVKKTYQRPRPFMVNKKPQCTPEFDQILRKDGSYPSGHAAVGYGWSMILAELLPDRAVQLVSRGRSFADSRRYCNVHWLSDTEQGMMAGTAVVARLHAEPAFQADLAAARNELAQAATRARRPTRDCAAEAAALQLGGAPSQQPLAFGSTLETPDRKLKPRRN